MAAGTDRLVLSPRQRDWASHITSDHLEVNELAAPSRQVDAQFLRMKWGHGFGLGRASRGSDREL